MFHGRSNMILVHTVQYSTVQYWDEKREAMRWRGWVCWRCWGCWGCVLIARDEMATMVTSYEYVLIAQNDMFVF